VKKSNTKWVTFIGISAQMGVTIFLFNQLGLWLDATYVFLNINFEKTVTVLGVFIAIYSVIAQVIRISNTNS